MNVQWVRKILFKIFSRWGNIAKLLGGYFLTASCIRSIVCSAPIHGTVDLKQDPNAGNSRVAASAEVKQYQNTISRISGHQSNTPILPRNSQGMASY